MPTTKDNIRQRNSKMLLIDGDKLRKLLAPYMATRKLSLCDISLDFGYGKNYLSNLLMNGVMSQMCCKMIEHEFGIKYDDYKALPNTEEKKEEKVEDTTVTNADSTNIESLIKAIERASCELYSLNKKLDDLFAQTQLNGELLQGIKDNTRPNKPYAYVKGSH